jgi:hypothetical protein
VNLKRLLLALGTGPFEKPNGGNDTTAVLKRFAEGWPLFERFGPGVDVLAGAAVVPRPPIDQTPTDAVRFSALEFRSDDKVLIGRRDIEARPIAGCRVTLIF